eukprot:COSAG06_NODE_30510_length_537_cov_8.043379_1_plen_83_part_00
MNSASPIGPRDCPSRTRHITHAPNLGIQPSGGPSCVQQKEAVAGLTRERRLALVAKREAGGDLTREEEAVLEAVERFDASSH